MRAGSKLVGYGQFCRQVAVKNVVGVVAARHPLLATGETDGRAVQRR